jgi:shikimate kinase/3-dehydroquinate synthase
MTDSTTLRDPDDPGPAPGADAGTRDIAARLGGRAIVLVGMMGAGKTSIGKRLAARLGVPFCDVDAEIELAANASVAEIFERDGEAFFRERESRVIQRLLARGAQVMATGGGAFMNPETRAAIKEHGISIWLKADLEVLLARVRRRSTRPLLKGPDPEGVMRRLVEERYPVYAEAALHVHSRDVPHDVVVDEILQALAAEAARPAPAADTVRVELGERSYDILIGPGLLPRAGAEIASRLPGIRTIVVSDATVAGFHLDALMAGLAEGGIEAVSLVLDPGEGTKSFAALERVVDAVLAARLERGDAVIALGGGVIGDLAGFAAGIVRRGMRFVQVPTSLLAQVDSSVGGKTGINTPRGKNLVGVFHQPDLVLADTGVLDTLSDRHFRAGYAEVAKYGLIRDAGFFAWLQENWQAVFAGGPARQRAIRVSCAAKAAVVAADERETGDRALLNLGHTFGHALEAATGYSDRLVHGEAIAIGMALAAEFSVRRGLCAPSVLTDVVEHFRAVGLPTRLDEIPGGRLETGTLMTLIGQDKKVSRGRLTFILLRAIGDAFVARDVPADEVAAFLDEKRAA